MTSVMLLFHERALKHDRIAVMQPREMKSIDTSLNDATAEEKGVTRSCRLPPPSCLHPPMTESSRRHADLGRDRQKRGGQRGGNREGDDEVARETGKSGWREAQCCGATNKGGARYGPGPGTGGCVSPAAVSSVLFPLSLSSRILVYRKPRCFAGSRRRRSAHAVCTS